MNAKKILERYKPIDYSKWEASGKGKNIIDELGLPEVVDVKNELGEIELEEVDSLETQIWKAALPFQDKRDDKGHAEFTTYFALRLLDYHLEESTRMLMPIEEEMTGIPAPQRTIVMSATILHDIGWSRLSDAERGLFRDYATRKMYEPMLRERHQVLGKELAKKILESVDYIKQVNESDLNDSGLDGEQCQNHILEIISQHDTRPGFYSLKDFGVNDGLMRDADKLWRVTLIGMMTEVERSKMSGKPKTLEEEAEKTQKSFQKPGFLYSPITAEIARIELENALSYQQKRERKLRK